MWASSHGVRGKAVAMRMTTIAGFMKMNGAVSGWRDGVRWLRLPSRKVDTIGKALDYRTIGRSGLRICSTVLGGEPVHGKLRDAHASGGIAR